MKQGSKIAGGNPERGRVDNDYYATHPDSTKAFLEVWDIQYPALEPACGEGHICLFNFPFAIFYRVENRTTRYRGFFCYIPNT